MTEEQINMLTASDTATLAMLSLMAGFLERLGVMKRDDLTAYVHEAILKWEKEGIDPTVLHLLRSRAAAFSEPGPGPILQ